MATIDRKEPKKLFMPEAELIAEMYRRGEKLVTIQRIFGRDHKTIMRAFRMTGTEYAKNKTNDKRTHYDKTRDTLCWRCQRAAAKPCDQCPWSMNGQPVPGWKAKETICDRHWLTGVQTASYHVMECPMFLADEPRKKVGSHAVSGVR